MRFLFLFLLLISNLSFSAGKEPLFSNGEIQSINNNTIQFMNNLNITEMTAFINRDINKNKFNNCYTFNERNKGYLPNDYIQYRCLYNSIYNAATKSGFTSALQNNNKNIDFINRSYQLITMGDDYPEELNYFNFIYRYPFNVNDSWVSACRTIKNPNDPNLPVCLSSIYRTVGNLGFADGYRKYMLACDSLYPTKNLRNSNTCIVNLVNKSVNPFERIQTNCMLHNYVLVNIKGNIRRKINENNFYKCLSASENNGYALYYWQAQRGFEYGYSLGIYAVKNKVFNFLDEKQQ